MGLMGLNLILWMDYLRRYIDINNNILYYIDFDGFSIEIWDII
jgi:hypothetical protein